MGLAHSEMNYGLVSWVYHLDCLSFKKIAPMSALCHGLILLDRPFITEISPFLESNIGFFWA